MTSTYYLTTLACALTKECEVYEYPVGRSMMENQIESIVLIQAFQALFQATVKVATIIQLTEKKS